MEAGVHPRAPLALTACLALAAAACAGSGERAAAAREVGRADGPVDVPCEGRRVLADRQSGERVIVEYGRCRSTAPTLVLSGGRFGFADPAGRVVVAPRFAYASEFSEGMAFVRLGRAYGYIDLGGRLAIRLPDSATVRAELVAIEVRRIAQAPTDTAVERCALQILPFGPSPLDFTPPQVYTVCGDTLPRTAPDTAGRRAPTWTFARREGAGDFYDGRARVRFGTKWGYIDRAGDLAIPARFDEASDFESGHASAVLRGQRVWIDRSGRVVDAEEVRRSRSL